MGAYGNIEQALEGMKFGLDSEVVSRVAGNEANFGKAAVVYAGDSDKAYQYLLDRSTATFAADFVASNVIKVTVNGKQATANWTTDQAGTIAAVVTAVNALDGVTCTYSSGRVIVITTQGEVCTASLSITGGASQTTMTQVLSCSASVFGVFLRVQKYPGKFEVRDVAPIVREGELWVMTADAVVANSSAYLVDATGAFTGASSGNVSTNFKFRTSTSGAALARLEVIK